MPFYKGQNVGPYRLIRELGRGSFKVVWLAQNLESLQAPPVAFGELLDPNPDMIAKEAALWVRASGHPNVVPVHSVNQHNGEYYIISEYVDGGSLKDWIETNGGQASNFRAAVDMTLAILAGLEHLHKRGIIHRDLKPANVLLQSGIPRIADFGISGLSATVGENYSRVPKGTPSYMAPEMFEGKYSRRSDLWSVGVMLYQMLTKKLPFIGSNVVHLGRVIEREPPAPLPPNTPEMLRRFVLRALEKERDRRFQSAEEMREELRRITDDRYWSVPLFPTDPSRLNLSEPTPLKVVDPETARVVEPAPSPVTIAPEVVEPAPTPVTVVPQDPHTSKQIPKRPSRIGLWAALAAAPLLFVPAAWAVWNATHRLPPAVPPRLHQEPRTVPIPFPVVKVPDDNLEEGSTIVRQKGKDGAETIVENVVEQEGKPPERHEVERHTVKPQDEIIAYGTIKVENTTKTVTIPIPAPQNVLTPSLKKGVKKLHEAGKAGERVIHEKARYRNGTLLDRVVSGSEIRTAALPPVYWVGTMTAPKPPTHRPAPHLSQGNGSPPHHPSGNSSIAHNTSGANRHSHKLQACAGCGFLYDMHLYAKCPKCGKPSR